MSWVKLDDQFFANPKVIDLSKDAKLLYLCGLTHCAAQLTDGLITAGGLRSIAALVDVDRALAADLVAAGLWEPTAGGYQVHDYNLYNPSAAQVKQERDQNARRQHEWREQQRERRNAVSHAVTNKEVTPLVTPLVTGAPSPSPSPSPSPINAVLDTNVVSISDSRHAHTETRATKPAPKVSAEDRRSTIRTLILSPPVRAWAAEHTPFVGVEDEAEHFLDYLDAHAKTYKDYPAAFRNWLRNVRPAPAQLTQRTSGNGSNTQRQPDKLTARLQGIAELINGFDATPEDAFDADNPHVFDVQSRPATRSTGTDGSRRSLGPGARDGP